MNKKDLIDALQQRVRGASKRQIEETLEAIGGVVTERLRVDNELNLPGIGKLTVKHKPQRQARNPRTGETVTVAASKAVRFAASSTLKAGIA